MSKTEPASSNLVQIWAELHMFSSLVRHELHEKLQGARKELEKIYSLVVKHGNENEVGAYTQAVMLLNSACDAGTTTLSVLGVQ